jgi:hypothetical protein
MITNIGPTRQILGNEIHRNGIGVSLGVKAYARVWPRRKVYQ